jgi:hypothetical protein
VPAACSSAETNAGSQVDVTEYRAALSAYDGEVEATATQLTALGSSLRTLQSALAADDTTATNAAIDAQVKATDELLAALARVEDLERRLQGEPPSAEGRITQRLVFVVGAGLVIYGVYTFGQKMKEYATELSAQRKQRDGAVQDVANGAAGAEDRLKEAKAKMNATGQKAITEFATKVTTQLVLSPVSPSSVGGLIIKQGAEEATESGLKVLTASKECSDPSGTGCKLSVGRTDSAGRVPVAPGEHTVVASSPGNARLVADGVKITEGKDSVVVRAKIPVPQATPEQVAANDKGQLSNTPDASAPGEGGVPTGAKSAECSQLATCCGKLEAGSLTRGSCDDYVARDAVAFCRSLFSTLERTGNCE